MLPTYTLKVTALGQDGQPISGYNVNATLNKADYTSGGSILPKSVTSKTDSDGVAELDLVSNLIGTQDSRYMIRVTNSSGGSVTSVTIQMPEGNTSLAQLVDQVPVTPEMITAAALSASIAEENAGIATTSAEQTELDRVATAEDAQTAAQAATEAEAAAFRLNALFWLGV